MKPAIFIGYVTLGFILFSSKVVECITCLNCKNIEDLSNCKELLNCKEDEVCYIDKVLSLATFAPQYNTGCKTMEYCKLEFCNKKAYGDGNSRRKRATGEDLTLCSECCYEDGCNAEGCGYKRPQNNNTQCFSCDEVYEGGPQCTDTIDCDLDLFACSVTNHLRPNHPGAYELGCKFKRSQCKTYISLNADQQDKNVKCCDTTLCNSSPYNRKVNKTAIAMDFDCPTGIARPTTTPASTTTPTTERPTTRPPLPKLTTSSPPLPPTKPSVNTTKTSMGPPTKPPSKPPTFTPSKPSTPTPSTSTFTTTNATTSPATTILTTTQPSTKQPTTTTTTTPPTVKTTTQSTTTTHSTTRTTTPQPTTLITTIGASTGPPPITLPPITTTCEVCAGPKFLCEKLHAPTPCPPPNNYCINTITNHKDGTKSVDRACGNFDTCYREWFLGSSDNDKCRKLTENDEQQLDFKCTFCCIKDNCNVPLHPADNTLYKPV